MSFFRQVLFLCRMQILKRGLQSEAKSQIQGTLGKCCSYFALHYTKLFCTVLHTKSDKARLFGDPVPVCLLFQPPHIISPLLTTLQPTQLPLCQTLPVSGLFCWLFLVPGMLSAPYPFFTWPLLNVTCSEKYFMNFQ